MTRYAVGVEYDGAGLAGWQRQLGVESVQQHVEEALGRVFAQTIALTAAGRTDAGVHARGQVAHFDATADRAERSMVLGANSYLPGGIALRWAQVVPDHFHARYSAQARTYRYCILNRAARSALVRGRAAFIYAPLDVEPMQAAAALLIGRHDFTSLRAAECQARTPVRELMQVIVRRVGEFVLIEVTANAFLHHMVRNIAGLLAYIGQGKASPQWVNDVLVARDRRMAPATAAAAGLYFWRVHYPPVFGLPDDSDIMCCPVGCPADLMDS